MADASAIVEYLLRTEHSEWIEDAIANANHDLHVPALCDVEVASALRRALRVGGLDEPRAQEAVEDYLDLPLTRHGHQSLVVRVLELRDNFRVRRNLCRARGASRRRPPDGRWSSHQLGAHSRRDRISHRVDAARFAHREVGGRVIAGQEPSRPD